MKTVRQHFNQLLTVFLRLIILVLLIPIAAAAQCVANPTGETAVGLKNASSYFLTFYIDGINMGGVPSGDRSVDFTVAPGSHSLRADAVINGETVSASRSVTIPVAYVCTWTVTDPPSKPAHARFSLRDPLESRRATVPLVIPNY